MVSDGHMNLNTTRGCIMEKTHINVNSVTRLSYIRINVNSSLQWRRYEDIRWDRRTPESSQTNAVIVAKLFHTIAIFSSIFITSVTFIRFSPVCTNMDSYWN